jgi:hypothetical protein
MTHPTCMRIHVKGADSPSPEVNTADVGLSVTCLSKAINKKKRKAARHLLDCQHHCKQSFMNLVQLAQVQGYSYSDQFVTCTDNVIIKSLCWTLLVRETVGGETTTFLGPL